MQSLSLSQYVPGESLLHGLDPRSKVVTILLLSVAGFAAQGPLELVAVSLSTLVLIAGSLIPARYFWESIRPFMILIIPTALLQMFLISGPTLYQIGGFTISENGLMAAGVLVVRLTVLILVLRILTLTTSPTAIINGCEKMFSPLRKLGLPVSELLTIMNLTLAFVPFFLEEGERIWMAQTSRGLSLREGSIKRRLESMLSLLVPLWRGAFERSSQLAEAMEARGYSNCNKRTHLHHLHLETADYLLGSLGLVALLLVLIH